MRPVVDAFDLAESDREESGRMNLYSVGESGGKPKQLTTFADFDIKFPSAGDKAIVFEQGGWIWRFDVESEKAEKVV